jgi:hypothetical protein
VELDAGRAETAAAAAVDVQRTLRVVRSGEALHRAERIAATLQTTEVHPPVPNEWLEQFGLPIAESDVLAQDPDTDGFPNLEEWHGPHESDR